MIAHNCVFNKKKEAKNALPKDSSSCLFDKKLACLPILTSQNGRVCSGHKLSSINKDH
jgi:hypothetical protein